MMLKVGSAFQLSASDLVGHLNCTHLTELEIEVASGSLERPRVHDPFLALLWERGAIHERDYLDRLAAEGHEVVRIDGTGVTADAVERSLDAMRAGADVIAQAALLSGHWSGRIDVLRRISQPSNLGDWSYEIIDTKLARETKAGTVLQLCLYSGLLASVQGYEPDNVYVVAPSTDFKPQPFRTASYGAYYRYVRRTLERSLETRNVGTYPDPKEHCELCAWRVSCDARRRRDDHLCLVAGITKIQIAELQRHAVQTTSALAAMPVPLQWKPERGVRQSYERSREQARVQVSGRTEKRPIYELITPAAGYGLARLPEPSTGDIFFDIEGDPFVGTGGIEYLFGHLHVAPDGEQSYVEHWALTPAEERRAFERFVDFVMARWAEYPALHIYHYSAYEPAALKRLMGRYSTREDEIDRMLRGGLFVDLYSITKQGIRASVESYTIKNLEIFYDYSRAVALSDARRALLSVQASLELGNREQISEQEEAIISGYNCEDCLSALHLRNWLEGIRGQLLAQGATIERPAAQAPEPTEEISERQRQVAALVQRLTHDVPIDRRARTDEQHALWILANTLDWHRRELKSVWWEYFRLSDLSTDDLLDERAALSGLEYVEGVGGTKKAPVHRYRFPPQDTELRPGAKLRMEGGDDFGRIESISYENRTVDIKKRMDTASVHPSAVFEHDVVGTDEQADALMRLGTHVATHCLLGEGPYLPARDLLLRCYPRLAPLHTADETTLDAATRLAPGLSAGVLPIQGPPGAGKTYTAARMICEIVRAGKKVGITANSHRVIRKVLDEVVKAADEQRLQLSCIYGFSAQYVSSRFFL